MTTNGLIERNSDHVAEDWASHPKSNAVGGAVGFSATELNSLRAAYSSGSRGTMLIVLRQGVRLLNLYIPASASEEALGRSFRPIITRLRAIHADGWLLARRAKLTDAAIGTTESNRISPRNYPIVALLIQERAALPNGEFHDRQLVSRLEGTSGSLTLHDCGKVVSTDRAVAMLIDAV